MTMPPALTWLDRLRIERVIWTVDVLVSDLPGRAQRTVRRELRANLTAAAAEVGTTEAIRHLGSLRRLAAGYLDAEFGEGGPRPRWVTGALWAVATEIFIMAVAFTSVDAFFDGVLAGNPHPHGTYTWHGPPFLGLEVSAAFVDRHVGFGFTMPLWILLYPVAALVLGARLWRLLPMWRRLRSWSLGA